MVAIVGWVGVSFVGAAVIKVIGHKISTGEPLPLRTACGFALRRWGRAFLLPMPCLILVGGLGALKVLMAATLRPGPPLDALLYLVHLAVSAVIVAAAIFLVTAIPLSLACAVNEDSGIRNALSAGLLFLMRAPWMCLLYELATVLRAAAVCALVGAVLLVASGGLKMDYRRLLTLDHLRAAWNESFSAQFAGDLIVGIIHALILFATAGYALALLFAGATGTYFAVRARVSGVPPAEARKK